MKDFIMEDLHKILEEEDSLGDFIKMNDIEEIYKFCKNKNSKEENLYTEEEFENKIDNLMDLLAKIDIEENEW